jgi:Na+/H+-dicarboxylate symporter
MAMALSSQETTRPALKGHPVLSETRARQGRFGRHVFWVLLISTLLAAIGLFAAWAFKSGDLAQTKARPTPAEARAFDAPQPPQAGS